MKKAIICDGGTGGRLLSSLLLRSSSFAQRAIAAPRHALVLSAMMSGHGVALRTPVENDRALYGGVVEVKAAAALKSRAIVVNTRIFLLWFDWTQA